MAQLITIKLIKAGANLGPFTIKDDKENVIAIDVPKETLKAGVTYSFSDDVKVVIISSTGKVKKEKIFPIGVFDKLVYAKTRFTDKGKACLWKHLTDPTLYNHYYGNIEPYILEYPFTYTYVDEIVQNVQDYTKVYQYLNTEDGVFTNHAKIELDDVWFNKAILYNGQQCSGILTLVPKPKNNLSAYLSYPILGTNEKTITYTKSDNFYQYNTFWSITKDVKTVQFLKDCSSLSIDKQINQANMDYSRRTHKKDTIRAKELKVRHILDNRSDVHLVSQFVITPTQNSFK